MTDNAAWTAGIAANAPLGGGLYVAGGTVTMQTDSVNGSWSGGGIFIASGATVYLDSSTVANTVNNSDFNIDGTYSPL